MPDFFDKVLDAGKDILGSVAPVLGTAIGGPFGGMAAKAITRALLGPDAEADDEQVALQAVQAATPEQLLALKKADQAFAVQMKGLDIDLVKVHAADRDSARRRQVETKDKMPAVIALAALAGFFGILGAMIFVEMPEAAAQPLAVMLGALGTLVTQIGAFYYGSSAGSAQKNAMIERMAGGARG